MAKPCTLHPIAQRVQFFKIETANANAFLLDGRRPFSFHGKKMGVAFVQRQPRGIPPAQMARNPPPQWGEKSHKLRIPPHLCGERSILWTIQ